MNNKNIKKMIDQELSDFVVTNHLKQRTLEKIHSPKESKFRYFFNVKLSLVSSLVVVFIVGINLLIPKTNESPINTFSMPNIEKMVPSNDAADTKEETTTTTTTEEDTFR